MRQIKELKFVRFLSAIFVCQLAGILGSVFTFSAITDWYAYLNKPFFSPPNWVFGPVWTTLYFLMGVSLFLVWNKGLKDAGRLRAVKLFGFQLVLNFFWSVIFFGLKSPLLAFIEILVLWYLIFLTIKAFYKISATAAYLLIPYLAWVSFASILNLAIIILN